MARYLKTKRTIDITVYDPGTLRNVKTIPRSLYRGLAGYYVKYDNVFYKVQNYGFPEPYISVWGSSKK